MIQELTPEEVQYIVEYTGMDIAMEFPFEETPVVFFSRNGNVINFVTLMSKDLNTI
jgi:hypothetical protein|tara:strand:+ start:2940 stop:3107 length:168 start_codon:yes stop_codon:yes gene_type:complete